MVGQRTVKSVMLGRWPTSLEILILFIALKCQEKKQSRRQKLTLYRAFRTADRSELLPGLRTPYPNDDGF
jgi:hypothetical protein